MRAAERWARRKGLAEVRLTVWAFNAPARAFYERLGFIPLAQELGKRVDPPGSRAGDPGAGADR